MVASRSNKRTRDGRVSFLASRGYTHGWWLSEQAMHCGRVPLHLIFLRRQVEHVLHVVAGLGACGLAILPALRALREGIVHSSAAPVVQDTHVR
jgi:hypothetical protein